MRNDIDRIRDALQFIPTGGHEERFRIGCMVKSELGDAGRDLWDEWRDGRGDDEAASVWKSISETGALKIGTLFHEAKANGWRNDGRYQKPSPEEFAERQRIAAERAEQEEAEIARERADTAKKAAAILKAATESKDDNPYLVRKRVSPVETLWEIDAGAAAKILGYPPKCRGTLLSGRLLVVPVKQGDGISTLELIDGNKRKAALAGRGSKVGGYWATQRLPDGDGAGLTLLIGEGVATVLSVSEATGHPAVAALSSWNLLAVAKAMRERYPAAALVILADLVKATGEPDPHAIEAATVSAGRTAIPAFDGDRDPDMTDFNDLYQAEGIDAVRDSVMRVVDTVTVEADVPQVETLAMPSIIAAPAEETDDTSVDEGIADGDADNTETTPDHSVFPGVEHRPCYVVLDDWTECSGRKYRPGVYLCSMSEAKKDTPPMLFDLWFCSPLYIDAVSFDGQDNNFGRLLRFKNSIGRWRKWAMPMELLRGSGDELRGELLAMGVELDPVKARQQLPAYLQREHPNRQVRCALQIGWTGKSFVLPDQVIGPDAAGVIFQSGERSHDEYTKSGTLQGWQEGIALKATGNPLLLIALSAGFAGPMLARCNAEGGGIHFVGDSSTGKTTAIEASCSIWGGPSYRRSWRATANGMEGAAALFNDCLLALDEISECDPKEVGAIVYALGNGRGKQRASRTGSARGVVRWRCFVLSSGERTIGTTMAEGGDRAKAGQSIRLLDIPAARKFGAWDDLRGAASAAAFSDGIKRTAAQHHGLVGRAFLERLTHDQRDFCTKLEEIKILPMFSVDGGEGQGKRAAGRFALIGLAGELATEYGLTGWREGEAIRAAAEGFRLWRSMRGAGNDERRQIAERMSGFLERHGDGRFSDADSPDEVQVRDRAGWWRNTTNGREYLLTAEAMRDAMKGFDFKRTLDVLQELGALQKPGVDGKRAIVVRIRQRPVRLYPINPDKLAEGGHDA